MGSLMRAEKLGYLERIKESERLRQREQIESSSRICRMPSVKNILPSVCFCCLGCYCTASGAE